MGRIAIENRNGMIVEAKLTTAGTSKKWDAGLELLVKQSRRSVRTVAADKGYDTKRFIQGFREQGITPLVAAKRVAAM